MLTNTMEITNKLYEEIKNSPVLEDSNVVFTKGFHSVSRNHFPFITIEYPTYTENILRAGSGMFTYSFEIYVGTKNLAPGVAYNGNDTGKKGSAELSNDIAKLLKGNSLEGTFIIAPHNIQVVPKYMSDDAETLVIGKVSFDAGVWFQY